MNFEEETYTDDVLAWYDADDSAHEVFGQDHGTILDLEWEDLF